MNGEMLIGAIGLVLSSLGSMLMAWWRFQKWVTRTSLQMELVQKSLEQVKQALEVQTKEAIMLAYKIDQREKDIIKLEGAFDSQRRDTIGLISGLQQSVSSLDAVWRTLQKLFPDKVPPRASDRV